MRAIHVALLAAAVAVAVLATMQCYRPAADEVPHQQPEPRLDPRVDALAARVEDLAVRLAAMETQSQRTPAEPVPAAPAPAASEPWAALERRLAALELALAGQPMDAAFASHLWLAQRQPDVPPQERAEQIGAGERTILDPSATVADKLLAHEQLRRVQDAYTPAMVNELLRIAQTSAEAQVRADVYRFFDGGSVVPALVPQLLHALAQDPEAIVRDEAAETLGNYLDDPAVTAALRASAESDRSARVRAKAQRTLGDLPLR